MSFNKLKNVNVTVSFADGTNFSASKQTFSSDLITLGMVLVGLFQGVVKLSPVTGVSVTVL
jgi:hypothetical protein